jgi:hypothetical protein
MFHTHIGRAESVPYLIEPAFEWWQITLIATGTRVGDPSNDVKTLWDSGKDSFHRTGPHGMIPASPNISATVIESQFTPLGGRPRQIRTEVVLRPNWFGQFNSLRPCSKSVSELWITKFA